MESIAAFPFVDLGSDDTAHVIVRADQGRISLALTLRSNGDLEVVMDPTVCRQLIHALTDGERRAVDVGHPGADDRG
jgi:hypothetical protein